MIEERKRFGLTLMVNHACNLRCSYCYTGAKFSSPMPAEIAIASIDRAFASLSSGGQLDLSFFGGEPLLESVKILDWMAHSREQARVKDKRVRFNLTTNGTITSPEAWRVMMTNDLDLAVSCDGLPEIHDRHRRDVQGRGSSALVDRTIRQLIGSGRKTRINMVVRPDTLDELPDGLIYLHDLGIRHVDLSLDLWTAWTAGDGRRLEETVVRAAQLWRAWLPEFALNWFDAKVGDLASLPKTHEATRCGFGDGEIAVAPSGRLYPCERLIGEDRPDHPLRLPGHALDGKDFLGFAIAPMKKSSVCSGCVLNSACDTGCRCSNFVRTGNTDRPDGLLCILNKATARAVSNVFDPEQPTPRKPKISQAEVCYG
jgi:uncharacterized protein